MFRQYARGNNTSMNLMNPTKNIRRGNKSLVKFDIRLYDVNKTLKTLIILSTPRILVKLYTTNNYKNIYFYIHIIVLKYYNFIVAIV